MTPRSVHAAPLRFLGLVLGGWICLRAAMLAPGWWGVEQAASVALPGARQSATKVIAPDPRSTVAALPAIAAQPQPESSGPRPLISRATYKRTMHAQVEGESLRSAPDASFGSSAPVTARPPTIPLPPSSPASLAQALPGVVPSPFAPPLPDARFGRSRWSGSAWLLARRERGEPALAPGGTLGGSQAGARILYRVNGDPARPLALTGRLYLPLHRAAGAEVAAGIDWQPAARLPVHILAERRQALGEEGRSAFALTLYGGVSRPLPHGVRVDAYGQAGVAGVRARDLFVDGSVRVTAPAGPVEIGGAAWGAAQPGAARLDAGPQVSVRIHAGPAALRLSADWRFRVAGDAAPDSGPALTLAADF